eukprot:1149081-Pelagomonas_calceolata.AAC.5
MHCLAAQAGQGRLAALERLGRQSSSTQSTPAHRPHGRLLSCRLFLLPCVCKGCALSSQQALRSALTVCHMCAMKASIQFNKNNNLSNTRYHVPCQPLVSRQAGPEEGKRHGMSIL